MARQNKRVVRYKAPININAGIVIFGLIFLYVAINVIIYFSTERVTYYEVVEGSVADDSNRSFTAVALRNESVYYAPHAGYINFYAKENSRVSRNTTLYSIDESGKINELLSQMTEEERKLSKENINTVKEELYTFVSDFDEMDFGSVYKFKSGLQGTVVELINMNALQNIYSSLGSSQEGQFEIKKAESSGIVEYEVDNYEELKPEKLKEKHFLKDNYKAAQIQTGSIVEEGTPIYKTINEEQWQLAIQLDSDAISKYKDESALKIRFKKDNTTVTTNFEIIDGADGKKYGLLTLQKYLIRYADQRFIDIEIIEDAIVGLKVPKKSIINKEFFVIPKEYKTGGGDSEEYGFIKRTYDKSEVKDVFTNVNILNEDDSYCYVSMDDFEAGDEIILPASSLGSTSKKSKKKNKPSEIYVVKDKQTLTGVYNINNGYTQFVFVDIITESGDFYIIESQSKYGLMVYDHIILNGETVEENQVIFQ